MPFLSVGPFFSALITQFGSGGIFPHDPVGNPVERYKAPVWFCTRASIGACFFDRVVGIATPYRTIVKVI